jgi:hypothetical protein
MTAYKHLTERRAKDRKIMADSIATLARSLGASADIVEFGPRSIMVEIETPQGLNVGVALEQCDAQLDDTLADKLRKAETERDNAQSRLRETDADGAKWRNLRDTVNYLLSPYTGTRYGRQTGKATKPAPKWAQHLIGTLARLEKQ